MLIAFGFAVGAASSWLGFALIALLLAGLFAAIYIPTILSEEAYLRMNFPGFEEYARAVPRLLPRWTAARFSDDASSTQRGGFSAELYRKHREYNALVGSGAIYAALILRLLLVHHLSADVVLAPLWR
jgi:hypothetical protein